MTPIASAPTPGPAPAPAPVADAPVTQQRSSDFDAWSQSRSTGAMTTTREAPPAPAAEAPAQGEALAEPMSDGDVAALDQHWGAVRAAVPPQLAQDFARAVQSGELPAALQGAVVRFQHGGQEIAMPVSELVRGQLRVREYSRRMNEVQQAQRGIDETVQNIKALFDSWNDPHAMLDSMRRLGKTEQFQKAAMALAREHLAEQRMTPDQRARKAAEQALADRERSINERLAAIEQRDQAQKNNARTDGITRALAAWVPSAFQRHGVPDVPIAVQWFQSNLNSMWFAGDLTQEMVDDAAALTADQYREALRQNAAGRQAIPQQPTGPRALPVQGLPGTGGAAPAQARRARLSDFDDHLRTQRR